MQSAAKLLQDRESDLCKLEMELKMLEGGADEEDMAGGMGGPPQSTESKL